MIEKSTICIHRETHKKIVGLLKPNVGIRINIGDFCDAIIRDWYDNNCQKELAEIIKDLKGKEND